MKIAEILRTRDGRPAVWEQGGGLSNTGSAVIVAGPEGQALPAAYVRRSGDLACREHALVPVAPGCVVVIAMHHRADFSVHVRRIVEGADGPELGPVVAEYAEGTWVFPDGSAHAAPDGPLQIEDESPVPWAAAVTAAVRKAGCYHCREAHYVARPRHVDMGR
jgi:hypothetical protein